MLTSSSQPQNCGQLMRGGQTHRSTQPSSKRSRALTSKSTKFNFLKGQEKVEQEKNFIPFLSERSSTGKLIVDRGFRNILFFGENFEREIQELGWWVWWEIMNIFV